MAKIINHPHWNDDLWDSPSETAQKSPDKLRQDDLAITSPNGLPRPDRRTADEIAVDAGNFAVDPNTSTGFIGNAIQSIDDMKRQIGNIEPRLQELQRDLDEDIRGLTNIIPDGYISVYCDTEITAYGNLFLALGNLFGQNRDQNRRLIPFNQHFGAHKGAHLDIERRMVVFDKPGTWLVTARVSADHVPRGGGVGNYDCWGDLITYTDADQMRETRTSIIHAPHRGTVSFSEVIVVPRAGYGVRLWVQSNNWRSWSGSIKWNNLTAVRLSHQTGKESLEDKGAESEAKMRENMEYESRVEGR